MIQIGHTLTDNRSTMDSRYPRKYGPLLLQYFSIVGTVALSIWLCSRVSYWFYPICLFLIGSRGFALSLLGHEGSHQLLFKTRWLNDLVARWLCHFPCAISHSHFTQIHLLHHRYLGESFDPDRTIYQETWPNRWQFIKQSFFDLLTLKTLLKFFNYFNGIPLRIKGQYPLKGKLDLFQFAFFWLGLTALFLLQGWLSYFFLFWFLPFYLWMPWIQLVNNYHHYHPDGPIKNFSRDIIFKNRLFEEILFPLNINIHRAHHDHVLVPFYHLRKLSAQENQNRISVHETTKIIFDHPLPTKDAYDTGDLRKKMG